MPPPPITPWSDNPYAPKISYSLYLQEKAHFSGFLIGGVLYGIVVVLFFQCMGAFFDPGSRIRVGIKWGLVVHTFIMFSLATTYMSMSADIQSVSFIDNRDFPASINGIPGPMGYELFIADKAIGVNPAPLLLINNWLADGLLLFRCYVVYCMNLWAIAIPALIYLGSVASGTMFLYEGSKPASAMKNIVTMMHFGTPYFSVSFVLNILLTLMIVVRLTMYRRNMRYAMGAAARTSGIYAATITILVESSALFAVSSLLFIGTWISQNFLRYTTMQILAQTQVIAPFLIVLRIAKQTAFTGETTRNASSTDSRGQGKQTDDSKTLGADGYTISSVNACELGTRNETIDLHHCRASGSQGSLKA